VRTKLAPGERPVIWMASSKKDLLAMPRPVVRGIGMAISVAQRGGKDPSAKSWKPMLISSGIGCRQHARIIRSDMAKRRSKKMEVEVGSGNVFADLGFPDAAELDIKVRLAVEIVRLINARRLSQVAAAALLKINQPKVSALKNYKLDGFSVERLMSFLLALGQDVEIRIRSRGPSKTAGRIFVDATRA
jgi:predicted XRE-type DNA-binding protein